MKILLTGGSGFLGRAVFDRARESGHQIFAPTRATLDLLDELAVLGAVRAFQPNAIIHCAGAVGGIGFHKSRPASIFEVNLRMGLNVLRASADVPGCHATIVSTICVYSEKAPLPLHEDDVFVGEPPRETSAYGHSKRTLLAFARALQAECGLPFSYVIPTNIYGAGESIDPARSHVVAAIMRKCIEAQWRDESVVCAWGDGKATRDLIHVDDVYSALLAISSSRPALDTINLGTGVELCVRQIAEAVAAATGFTGTFQWDADAPTGALRRVVDTTRAKNLIGFRPRMPLERGLSEMARWMRTILSAAGSHSFKLNSSQHLEAK